MAITFTSSGISTAATSLPAAAEMSDSYTMPASPSPDAIFATTLALSSSFETTFASASFAIPAFASASRE